MSDGIGVNQALARIRPGTLCILGYHGFSLLDEYQFRPMLFMRGATFESRILALRDRGYKFVSLEEGLAHLDAGRNTSKMIVVTIDDGFYSVLTEAVPALKRHAIASTLYVSTYYAIKQTPIFRLILFYMAWKAKATDISPKALSRLPIPDLVRDPSESFDAFLWRLVGRFENEAAEEDRVLATTLIAQDWQIDVEAIRRSRAFSLLSLDELAQIEASGVSVQLHTHRHRFPVDAGQAQDELDLNHHHLGSRLSAPLEHFCYPSGLWDRSHVELLDRNGIRSAVTCEPGLNDKSTHRLLLSRVLDSEEITLPEFLAEVSGVKMYLRKALGKRQNVSR